MKTTPPPIVPDPYKPINAADMPPDGVLKVIDETRPVLSRRRRAAKPRKPRVVRPGRYVVQEMKVDDVERWLDRQTLDSTAAARAWCKREGSLDYAYRVVRVTWGPKVLNEVPRRLFS